MAHESHNGFIEPAFKAASAIGPKTVVTLDTVNGQVVAATLGAEPVGVTIASAAQGDRVTVLGQGNIVKAVAVASLGWGAVVGVASTNGALGPVTAASGVVRWALGTAREPAAAGETFSVFVNPRSLDAQI
jgi:hypothetical protein